MSNMSKPGMSNAQGKRWKQKDEFRDAVAALPPGMKPHEYIIALVGDDSQNPELRFKAAKFSVESIIEKEPEQTISINIENASMEALDHELLQELGVNEYDE